MKIIEQGVETYLNNSVLVKEGVVGWCLLIYSFVCCEVQNCYGQKITSPYISLSLPQTSCQFPCFCYIFYLISLQYNFPCWYLVALDVPCMRVSGEIKVCWK